MNGTKYYMKDEVSFQDFPSYSEKGGRKKPMVAFFVILLIIAGVIAGLFFLGQSGQSEPEETRVLPTETAPVPTTEPTPTPEPTPDLDRADLSIAVLNGSGVAGAAGDVADILRELGYTVSSTGNANRFDYEGITINISEEDEDFLNILQSDLEDSITDKTITATTSSDLTSGAEVIVGQ